MKFDNLKFAYKLSMGFGILISIALILGSIAVINMTKISKKSKNLAHEYVPEVRVSNNIERHSLLTMYNMRGYGYTEENAFLEQGQAQLAEVKKYLAEASELADASKQLTTLKGAIAETESKVLVYEDLAKQTVNLNLKLASLRQTMDESAALFLNNCFEYLDNQNKQMNNEIINKASSSNLKERHSKVTLINDIIDKGNSVRVANFKSQAMRDPIAYQKAFDDFSIAKEIAELREVTRISSDIAALDQIELAAKNYKEAMSSFIIDWKAREELNSKRNEAANVVLANAQEVAKAGIEQTTDIANTAEGMLSRSSMVMIIGLLVAIILGIILSVVLTRSITTGLRRGVVFAQRISDGDLTVDLEEEFIDRSDEIGQLSKALTGMVQRLRDIVENIILGSETIAAASQQMASTSQEMSQGASEQASSVEEVSSSMEEMGSNIQQNTDNARQTESIATSAAMGIREGSEATNISVSSMRNIAEKVKIINEIAFQTNLLALNAAVEAARAGEHGRGFAVVASEVRKLAERSRVAADEIDKLTVDGVNISEVAGRKLQEMVPQIEKTANLVQEIAAASIEQNGGVNQINNAMAQLNTVTQQNAAASEEMATSSEELASQAEQLKATIQYFTIDRKTANKSVTSSKSASKGIKTQVNKNTMAEKSMVLSGEDESVGFESF